mgnify:CR=1 FL=1
MSEQLHFNLPGSETQQGSSEPEQKAESTAKRNVSAGSGGSGTGGPGPRQQKRLLQRAVLRWLVEEQEITALARDVPTRVSRYRADVAGFRSKPFRNSGEGPSRILTPQTTLIVQCYVHREQCWPDCTSAEQLLERLRQLKQRQAELEEHIRQDEPELRRGDSLFEEYAEWNYAQSRNPEFHKIRRDIHQTEHAIYRGTKFEQIRQAELADLLYVAVPWGELQESEVADGWGLLWISRDLGVTPIKEPEHRECLPAHRVHLIQNIASAATTNVLAVNGIRRVQGEVRFVKAPRGHRKKVQPRLW